MNPPGRSRPPTACQTFPDFDAIEVLRPEIDLSISLQPSNTSIFAPIVFFLGFCRHRRATSNEHRVCKSMLLRLRFRGREQRAASIGFVIPCSCAVLCLTRSPQKQMWSPSPASRRAAISPEKLLPLGFGCLLRRTTTTSIGFVIPCSCPVLRAFPP